MAIVHWPVECDEVAPQTEGGRRRLCEHVSTSGDERVILYLGRLHPSKRIHELIEAFVNCGQLGWKLVIAGPVDRTFDVRRFDDLLGRSNGAVAYVGPVFGEVKRLLYQSADLFVSFSLKENFGYTIAEALAHGVPAAISPDLDLYSDLATVGCVYSLGTQGELCRRLRAILASSSGELRDRGIRGRAWALDNLSWMGFRDRLGTLLEAAAASPSSPREIPKRAATLLVSPWLRSTVTRSWRDTR